MIGDSLVKLISFDGLTKYQPTLERPQHGHRIIHPWSIITGIQWMSEGEPVTLQSYRREYVYSHSFVREDDGQIIHEYREVLS